MTREELKAHCERQIELCEMWAYGKGEEPSGKVYKEHKMVLELLEQESCDAAISRILKRMWNCRGKHTTSIDKVKMEQIIRDELSSAILQPKIGHWIKHDTGHSIYYVCSICSCIVSCMETEDSLNWKFRDRCPDCEAKMEVEE